ncbi:MAG: PilN domain-containing protein [Acidobacteria bacterium]|nr:PilN domain-containing protein [Acidobacteriota bacterium]
MIKVNLLIDHTVVRKRKSFVNLNVSRTGLVFAAFFLFTVGAMGIWTYYVHQQIQTGTERRERLRLEEQRLQMLKKEIARFEQLTKMRQNRIDVIEKLKENQTGPVLLLNKVLESIPSNGVLWLTSLSQKSDLIKIVGYTQQPEVIPDFMTGLAGSGIFKSVDLDMIEDQKDASKFSLSCVSISKSQAE